MEGRVPRERRFLPNPIEEWDTDEAFMIKLLDVILEKFGWIGDPSKWMGNKYPSDIKALPEIKASFYEEKPRGR